MRGDAETEAKDALADAAWAVAERLGKFGYAEISAELGISMKRAARIVRSWRAAGACDLIQSGPKNRNVFQVVPEAKRLPNARRRGSAPQNIWNAMRGLRAFTPTDLAAHARTDDVVVTSESARSYCQALLRAGYLKVERKAVPGRREAIYRLIRNTGPKPPRERRVRAVVDDNLGEIVHVDGSEGA